VTRKSRQWEVWKVKTQRVGGPWSGRLGKVGGPGTARLRESEARGVGGPPKGRAEWSPRSGRPSVWKCKVWEAQKSGWHKMLRLG